MAQALSATIGQNCESHQLVHRGRGVALPFPPLRSISAAVAGPRGCAAALSHTGTGPMSRKQPPAAPPEWFPTANAIRRRFNERLAEGVPGSAMTIAMDDAHFEVFWRTSGGRWKLCGTADLFGHPVIRDARIEGWDIRSKAAAPKA